MRRTLAYTLAATSLLVGLTACTPNTTGIESASSGIEVSHEMILLDVRTPAEFAAGHLAGARLLDLSAGELAAAIPNLDPNAAYLVYCRSGNRSGQAITLLNQAGFTNLTNLGSLEQAARATKLAITH